MKLYGFWRSLAAYRVRVALKLKGLTYTEESVDLLAGAQHAPAFLAINAQGAVPALLLDDGSVLTQSMAIMEYIDEAWPETNALLPSDRHGRSRVRSLCHLAVSDAHPLVVPRIRKYLAKDLALAESAVNQWLKHWSDQCLQTFDRRLGEDRPGARFCHGEQVSMADIVLASQVIGAVDFFGCQLSDYPQVQNIYNRLNQMDAFTSAHPNLQPGAPATAA
jgi:maleylacetoacetate isomerase